MRRSNWKLKVLIVDAMALGITAAILAAIFVENVYAPAKGMAFVVALFGVAMLVTFIGVKVFKIGRD